MVIIALRQSFSQPVSQAVSESVNESVGQFSRSISISSGNRDVLECVNNTKRLVVVGEDLGVTHAKFGFL